MSTIDIERRNNMNTISYNEKLKEKITNQAKRLTQLALEKEELLELLKEKTMTLDVSLETNIPSNKNSRNSKSANNKKNKGKNYLKELIIAQDKIKELEENKKELDKFKKTVCDRLNKANNDIDKTKESLIIMENEKKTLIEQVYNLTTDKENNDKQIKKISKNYDEQIKDLINKNKKLFYDNKQLLNQIKKISNENQILKKDNISLKNINFNFTKTIDNLTQKLSKFQNEINDTIKKKEVEKYEKIVNELNIKIKGKNIEISKMKELQNNYELLENELSNVVDEKDKNILNLSKQINLLNTNKNQLEIDNDKLQIKISEITNENQKIKNEVFSLRKKYEQINSQFQSMNNMKNSQINNLKKYNEVLEEKVVKIEKNKSYLEHLLLTTHPSKNLIKDILELYYQISGLEIEKNNIENEYLYKPLDSFNENNDKETKKKAINNISQQINKLKKYLKSMEEGITIN